MGDCAEVLSTRNHRSTRGRRDDRFPRPARRPSAVLINCHKTSCRCRDNARSRMRLSVRPFGPQKAPLACHERWLAKVTTQEHDSIGRNRSWREGKPSRPPTARASRRSRRAGEVQEGSREVPVTFDLLTHSSPVPARLPRSGDEQSPDATATCTEPPGTQWPQGQGTLERSHLHERSVQGLR